ncbi:MAG: radical SAM protein [Desulfobacteraceae bacterium]|nr:MAG: radical SAM protein [Desulfobacteraceae bacterium]
MAPLLRLGSKQTKPHLGGLAPGCRICAQGEWSCLFINGRCNCRCFYCPTEQNETGRPTTNRIPFETPEEYADYVGRFGFSGVSISGGEPLLTFERTLEYITAVRERLGSGLHIWMYTNGTLATPQRLKALRSAGLDEIRFDISAVDYDLQKVRMAAECIPCVTVEIPAIPEDFERLAALLPEMARAGVAHLNLHQLRLTPHNCAGLKQRNYTYLHGESVTVLESELTALSLMQAACEQDPALPINYCSFVYKRRYQQAATRRRNAQGIIKEFETVTENGFIRALCLAGRPEEIGTQAERLVVQAAQKPHWALSAKKDRLQFHPSLWPLIDFSSGRLRLTYSEAVLAPCISYQHMFKELRLAAGKKIYIEKRPLRIDMELDEAARRLFENEVLSGVAELSVFPGPALEQILAFEFIRPGLQDYF